MDIEKNQITVLHSTNQWLPQTMTWLYNQIRFLLPIISSHIVCESTANLSQFNLPNIHSFSNANFFRYYWDKSIRKLGLRQHLEFQTALAKKNNVDILHSHFGNRGWIDLNTAKSANVKHVVTFYGVDVNHLPKQHPFWLQRYQVLFEKVDKVLCEGPHMAQCIGALGCPDKKVQVHHLGINLDEIKFKPRIWSPGDPLRVLIASTFREKKGIPYALEALGRLQETLPLEITLIGDASNEPRSQKEKQNILAVIKKYNLQPKLRMPGFQNHNALFEEAYRHHIFLSPSVTASDGDTEGGAPVSIIELLASGMPVVSTNHCDIPQIIKHKITGLLAEERDIEGLMNNLQWLIDNSKSWLHLVEAGRRHVEEEYNAKIQGERLTRIYQELMSKAK